MPHLSFLAVIIYIIPVAASQSPNQPIVATAVRNASVHVDFAETWVWARNRSSLFIKGKQIQTVVLGVTSGTYGG